MPAPEIAPGSPTRHVPGVLVVGAGYAGLHAARGARSRGGEVTVLDAELAHDFTCRLAAVAGGTEPSHRAARPLDEFVSSPLMGRAVEIGDGWVELDDGQRLEAGAVVATVGATPSKPDIEGIEHLTPLRTALDASTIRRSLPTAQRLLIVGGGPTGVQLAGSAASRHSDLEVHLFDVADRLLPSMEADLGTNAARILTNRGVALHLGCQLDRAEQGAMSFDDGSRWEGICVWAAGFEAASDLLTSAPRLEGRVEVDEVLRVKGWERTFAAGDLVAHIGPDGDVLAMAAQIAVKAGKLAGANAARLLAGKQLQPADLDTMGWVLDLGGHQGLASIGGVHLAGPLLDRIPPLLHHYVDAQHVVQTAGPGMLIGDALKLGWRRAARLWPGVD